MGRDPHLNLTHSGGSSRRVLRRPYRFNLSIAGDGAERERLEALAREAGVEELSFSGFTDKPHAFLAGLHLYVQPSRSEGFCIAAHEAMTAGLPVIASAVGELPHSIQPGATGLVVPPGDEAVLAQALRTMLDQPERLDDMGVAARRDMLDRFSQARFAATGTAILNRIRAASA